MNIAVSPPVIPPATQPAATQPTSAQRSYATIALSDYRSAQGPILRQYLDGRVVIDTGKGRLTGRPLTATPGPAPIWMPFFGSLF